MIQQVLEITMIESKDLELLYDISGCSACGLVYSSKKKILYSKKAPSVKLQCMHYIKKVSLHVSSHHCPNIFQRIKKNFQIHRNLELTGYSILKMLVLSTVKWAGCSVDSWRADTYPNYSQHLINTLAYCT